MTERSYYHPFRNLSPMMLHRGRRLDIRTRCRRMGFSVAVGIVYARLADGKCIGILTKRFSSRIFKGAFPPQNFKFRCFAPAQKPDRQNRPNQNRTESVMSPYSRYPPKNLLVSSKEAWIFIAFIDMNLSLSSEEAQVRLCYDPQLLLFSFYNRAGRPALKFMMHGLLAPFRESR